MSSVENNDVNVEIKPADLPYEPPEPVFVSEGFVMNPNTETLMYAVNLFDGMEVLIADSEIRRNYNPMRWSSEELRQTDYIRALRTNRWCKVTEIRYSEQSDTVTFIGLYEDGFQFVRTHDVTSGFLVKKSSITLGMKAALARKNRTRFQQVIENQREENRRRAAYLQANRPSVTLHNCEDADLGDCEGPVTRTRFMTEYQPDLKPSYHTFGNVPYADRWVCEAHMEIRAQRARVAMDANYDAVVGTVKEANKKDNS